MRLFIPATHADFNNATNAQGFAGQPPFDAMIAESKFEHGKVVEIRRHPSIWDTE